LKLAEYITETVTEFKDLFLCIIFTGTDSRCIKYSLYNLKEFHGRYPCQFLT